MGYIYISGYRVLIIKNMKRLIFVFLCLLIISQFITSCNSNSSLVNQFSKRKYLKKYKSKNVEKSFVVESSLNNNYKLNKSQIVYASISEDVLRPEETNNINKTLVNEVLIKENSNYFYSGINELVSNKISKVKITQKPDSTYHVYIDPPDEKKININALSSFIGSLLAVPIIPLIWGVIGLSQIKKSPERYSGKGLAIIGIILGILTLIAGIILIATFGM